MGTPFPGRRPRAVPRPPLGADARAPGHPRPGCVAPAGPKPEKPGGRPEQTPGVARANSRRAGDSAPGTPPAGSTKAPNSVNGGGQAAGAHTQGAAGGGRAVPPHPGLVSQQPLRPGGPVGAGGPAGPTAPRRGGRCAGEAGLKAGGTREETPAGATGFTQDQTVSTTQRHLNQRPRRRQPSRQLLTLPVKQPGQPRATPPLAPQLRDFTFQALSGASVLSGAHTAMPVPQEQQGQGSRHPRVRIHTHKTRARRYTHTCKGAPTHTCTLRHAHAFTRTHRRTRSHADMYTQAHVCTLRHARYSSSETHDVLLPVSTAHCGT